HSHAALHRALEDPRADDVAAPDGIARQSHVHGDQLHARKLAKYGWEPMARALEFFFDYGSPYSYLANAVLPAIAARHAAELVYRPMLLGAVFKATGNQSPIHERVAAKRAYGGAALLRTAAYHGVPIAMNPHFPINTLSLMRSAVAAQDAGVFERFHAAV